jgi:hypothetical protein
VNLLEAYLHELREIRASGAAVKELSYYLPLANLLNEVGRQLRPRVRCIQQMQSVGAGTPDFGLFTADQFRRAADLEPLSGIKPARGVGEIKGLAEDPYQVMHTPQLARYLAEYRLVLVTNYREFVLVSPDRAGQPVVLESYELAAGQSEFWALAAHPRQAQARHAQPFLEFLRRALWHAAPLSDPKDLAWLLASYAREAGAHLEHVGELPGLAALRRDMEEALGIQFQGEKAGHFFRSTLVQTLFYGLFSAWMLWHHEQPLREDAFDWRLSSYYLRVRVIQALFWQLSNPTRLQALGLMDYLERAGAALNRVERPAFFARFDLGQAVQYFYEPFLEAYDPQLRKELGVWYTPPEIVRYMVARVDAVLRQELGAADGLADPGVLVLDPCCGTGAYLVETLKCIAATLQTRGEEALLGYHLKQAAMQRVFGFELLTAPFVIAHLQLGLLLQQYGAPLAAGERAGVYLTNALTGWQLHDGAPAGGKPRQLALPAMPELAEEHDAADQVKQHARILVVLGNPPYNAFAGVAQSDEERALVQPYKAGLIERWGIKKFNLDDLYVRFFRLAERRIAEMTGRGVVCFISNHSWLSDPSFVVMRQHLLSNFDCFWVENMHGDRKISEYAPDGHTSETIFAMSGFSPGIRQGVAISLWLKSGNGCSPRVLFRDDLEAAKADERRAQLLASLQEPDFDGHYQAASPTERNRFSFRPAEVCGHYAEWPRLTDLCAIPPSNGLMEKRAGGLMAVDHDVLERRMRMYFNLTVSWDSLKSLGTGLTEDAACFDAQATRTKALGSETYHPDHLRRYILRPFDTRWCYYSTVPSLWNRPRPSLWAQHWEGNTYLMSRFKASKSPEGPPFYFARVLADDHSLSPDAACFPFRVRSAIQHNHHVTQIALMEVAPAASANLSPAARTYLAGLGVADPDAEAELAPGLRPFELLWLHALAVGYAPAYLAENADGIRQDWPRIPLPDSLERLLASAALGRQVAALLDSEMPVPGVTAGAIRPELKCVAVLSRVGGGPLTPGSDDLAVTAGWGHAGQGGVVMPGRGRLVKRPLTPLEVFPPRPLGEGAGGEGHTCDVYLNDRAYYRNLPPAVWEFTIGGYQVVKKWLSYRERALLRRPLSAAEAGEFTHIARRLAALVLLQPALDASYRVVEAAAYAWPAAAR